MATVNESFKHKKYVSYKSSGIEWVNEIPEHWSLSKIKYTAKFQVGWTPSTKDDENFVGSNLWANISDIGQKEIFSTKKKISDSAAKFASMEVTPAGSLLYSFKLSVGAVTFAGIDMYTNEAIASFLEGAKVPLSFLYYSLPIFVIKNASTNIYGARILNQELIQNASILVPSFDECLTIASFLDHETAKIDTAIEKQQKLIELLKEKRQAVISHAVTKGLNPDVPVKDSGVKWLGDVPECWDCIAISKLTSKITNGYVGPTRDILVSEGVPYVQATHIKKGKVNFDDTYFVCKLWSNKHSKSILEEGDVLVVQTGAGTGDVGLVQENEIGYNCHALIILQSVTDKLVGEYLSYCLQSDYGRSILYSIRTGGMHPHLNCSEVKYVKIPLPSIAEQKQICEFINFQIDKFDNLIEKQQYAIQIMIERRTALISAAVTGKIDVREWKQTKSEAEGRQEVEV